MKNKHPYIAVIDFDGTIATTDYPTIIRLKKSTANFIYALQKHDSWIWTLSTARTGKELQEALEFLEKNQLYPDLVNENHYSRILKYGSDSRKINGDVFIDNLNFGGLKVPDPETFFDEFEKEQQRKEDKK